MRGFSVLRWVLQFLAKTQRRRDVYSELFVKNKQSTCMILDRYI